MWNIDRSRQIRNRERSEIPACINDIKTRRCKQPPHGQATHRIWVPAITYSLKKLQLSQVSHIASREYRCSFFGHPSISKITAYPDEDIEIPNKPVSVLNLPLCLLRPLQVLFRRNEKSPSETEDPVSISLMRFLYTLTIDCQRAKLDWDVNKKGFKFQLGNANIRTISGGCRGKTATFLLL